MNEETKIGNVNIAVINVKKGVEPILSYCV
jgi:hypothetical protein